MQQLGSNLLSSVEYFNLGDGGSWQEFPSLSHHRVASASTVLNGYIYVVGGGAFMGAPNHSSAERFDPQAGLKGCWEELPPMSTRRLAPTAHSLEAGHQPGRPGCVVVVGGNDGTTRVTCSELFDPGEHRWRALPMEMTSPRVGHAGGVLAGSRVVVCGGEDNSRALLASAELLDLQAGRWLPAPPMPGPRFGARGAVLGEKLYVCGGCERADSDVNLASVVRFDPDGGGLWETIAPMSAARFTPAVCAAKGRLFVLGGKETGSMFPLGERLGLAEAFDPETGSWQQLPPLITARSASVAVSAPGPPPRSDAQQPPASPPAIAWE